MLAEILDELGEAARILLLETRACRVADQARGVFFHALGADLLGGRLGVLLELLVAVAAGAGADARKGERQGPVGIAAAEMGRGKRALRQAHHVRLGDLQVVEHVPGVVDGMLLGVHRSAFRHIGAGVAAEGVGDAA